MGQKAAKEKKEADAQTEQNKKDALSVAQRESKANAALQRAHQEMQEAHRDKEEAARMKPTAREAEARAEAKADMGVICVLAAAVLGCGGISLWLCCKIRRVQKQQTQDQDPLAETSPVQLSPPKENCNINAEYEKFLEGVDKSRKVESRSRQLTEPFLPIGHSSPTIIAPSPKFREQYEIDQTQYIIDEVATKSSSEGTEQHVYASRLESPSHQYAELLERMEMSRRADANRNRRPDPLILKAESPTSISMTPSPGQLTRELRTQTSSPSRQTPTATRHTPSPMGTRLQVPSSPTHQPSSPSSPMGTRQTVYLSPNGSVQLPVVQSGSATAPVGSLSRNGSATAPVGGLSVTVPVGGLPTSVAVGQKYDHYLDRAQIAAKIETMNPLNPSAPIVSRAQSPSRVVITQPPNRTLYTRSL